MDYGSLLNSDSAVICSILNEGYFVEKHNPVTQNKHHTISFIRGL